MMCRAIVVGVMLSALLAIPVLAADAPAKGAAKTPKPVSQLVVPAAKAMSPESKHFLTKWLLLGPITFAEGDFGGFPQTGAADKEFVPKEGDLDGTQTPPKGAKWVEKSFANSANPGEIDLGETEHAVMYAVAWLDCPEDIKDARLLTGSDDYIKVWINGELVWTFKTECRAGEADQDTKKGITLKKGENRIVVKCVQILGAWNFYLRFADKDGNAFTIKTAAPAPAKAAK